MRVIIERDPGQAGQVLADRVKAAAQDIAGCDVTIVDRAVPQALITERPDLDYQREVEKAGEGRLMAEVELQERPSSRRIVRREKRVQVSAATQDAWTGLRTAISAAAALFTKQDRFPISPFYADMLSAADADLDRALRAEARADLNGQFDQDAEGRLHITLWWLEVT